MTLRRRGQTQPTSDGPIDDFWSWWGSAGHVAAEAGIAGAGFETFTAEINRRVEVIHPDLDWELAPGKQAQHALVVTAGGVPELRRLAERWCQRAPAVSEIWEYYPARQANPSSFESEFQRGPHRLNLADVLFDLHVYDDRWVVDTVVFHPAFAAMPPETRAEVGMLALDWALGEDDVTRWIGSFEAATARPSAGVPVDGLIETVEALAERTAQDGWVPIKGERKGGLVMGSLALPAKWVDRPLLDTHVAVILPFADQSPEGMPSGNSLDRLQKFEQELTSLLEPRGHLVAYESYGGVRTFHLYIDRDTPELIERVRSSAGRWPGARVKSRPDPGWRTIKYLTG